MLLSMMFCGNLRRNTLRNSKNLHVIIGKVIHEKAFQRLVVNICWDTGLSGVLSVEEILHQVEQSEKDYDWLGAAESYGKAINLLPEDDFSRKGDITERLGYAFYRAAFQAENNDEFRERMRQSVANYQKAKEFYGRLNEQVRTPRTFRCDAMIAYTGYWLAPQVSEKKRLLDECWKLTKEALKSLDKAGSALEYGETYNQLSSSAQERYCFESNFQLREELIREAMHFGELAIILLSRVSAPYELAKAYVKTAMYLSVFAMYFTSDMDDKEGYYRKGLGYWQKATELSEETAFLELLSLTSAESPAEWSVSELLVQYGKALEYARKTKDKYLVGTALEWLKYATGWTRAPLEDPDKIREVTEKVLQYSKDAKHQFSIISYASPYYVNWTGAAYAEYYQNLADLETDLRKKRDLLEKAMVEYAVAVKQAEGEGYPDVIGLMHGKLGVCLVSLAKMETNSEEKRKLLESADEHLKISMELRGQLERFNYWNLGALWMTLANLRAELSQIETDDEKKKNMLEEAVSYSERDLQLCIKSNAYLEKKGDLILCGYLGLRQYVYGERLGLLYGLTHNHEVQRKAIKAFKDSAESFQKLNLVSRVAESCWKVARSYDALGEHLKAAENFNFASDNYKRAAEKIPQLKDFYQEHACYMAAWSEIEKARHHHERQEYGLAKEHFEKAADLHRPLKKWGYLAPNYCAWANVEDAEDFSRKEQCEESIQAFEQAIKLFDETKRSLHNELSKIEDLTEKQMANSMATATNVRQEYCEARIALEEAKILDKKGDHYASSQKYGSAAETFEKLSQALESEQEQREFKFITSLSRAWQKMTRAEAEASPTLYFEASQLFEKAKEFGPTERIKMLTLGHSRFCRALEAGTRFVDTRDATLHDAVIQHLGSAADYYLKAGFQNASEYAKATKLFFDAYVHIGNAERETDPEKKTKLYTMAEKILQTSAGSFLKAEHPEKREQVLRLMEKVKEERELALSLSEVLHASAIVSTTVFSAPTPTHESAVGLERFEQADIQANLIVRQKELKIGEPLNLEIELVNAGKGPALLIKVNKMIPEGFDLTEKPENCRVEDSYIDMKGKRLGPLKTEELRLVLKPRVQGAFVLKPTVLYLDENGRYKSHEPESVTIIVKELGIKGWLKGER